VPTVGLSFDWSNPCQEGHVTRYLDGMLEEMSDVSVNRSDGTPVAEGWLDFIHGGGDAPLFVFSSSSGFAKEMLGVRSRVKQRSPGMSGSDCLDHGRDVCTSETTYDARWSGDPLVVTRTGTCDHDEVSGERRTTVRYPRVQEWIWRVSSQWRGLPQPTAAAGSGRHAHARTIGPLAATVRNTNGAPLRTRASRASRSCPSGSPSLCC
jgi:hypothetical protein